MTWRSAVIFLTAIITATQVVAQGHALGAYYTKNLPGDDPDNQLPPSTRNVLPLGTMSIGSVINRALFAGEISIDEKIIGTSVVRLPNGHYVVGGRNRRFVIEFDTDWEIVGTAATPQAQLLVQMPGSLVWDQSAGTESRVWLGVAPPFSPPEKSNIRSFDWQNLRFDEPSLNDSFGLKALEGVNVPSRTVSYGVIAEINSQKTWITSDRASLNFNSMEDLSLETLPMTQAQVQLSPRLPDTVRAAPVYDPIDQTIWFGALGSLHQPYRFVEHNLDGQVTGRIFQPQVPLLPEDLSNVSILGADLHIDGEGTRVLSFLIADQPGLFGASRGRDPILVEVKLEFLYANGCNGELSFIGDARIGAPWELTLSNTNPDSANTAFLWRGFPVIDRLQPILGVTNCALHMSLSSGFGVIGAALLTDGQANLNLNVPNSTFLIGIELGFQWLIPGATSPLPLGLSSAGAIRIGSSY